MGDSLSDAGRAALNSAAVWLLLAAVSAALVIAVFDWQVGDVARGALLGIAIWEPIRYLGESARSVPRGRLVDAPAGMEPTRPRLETGRVALAVALCVPFAWLADRWDVGAVFVPGMFCGFAAAELLVLGLTRRWERANRRRALIDPDADEPRPLAGAPL